MESYSRFTRCIYKWEASLLDLVGHNFLINSYRKTTWTYLFYALIASTLIAQLYSVFYYDLFTKIFAAIGTLLTLQVILQISANNITKIVILIIKIIKNQFEDIKFNWLNTQHLVSGCSEVVPHPVRWWTPMDYWENSNLIRSECNHKVT